MGTKVVLFVSLWGLFVCIGGLAFLPQPRIDRILAPVLPQGLFIFFVLEVCMTPQKVPCIYRSARTCGVPRVSFLPPFRAFFFFYKIYFCPVSCRTGRERRAERTMRTCSTS